MGLNLQGIHQIQAAAVVPHILYIATTNLVCILLVAGGMMFISNALKIEILLYGDLIYLIYQKCSLLMHNLNMT